MNFVVPSLLHPLNYSLLFVSSNKGIMGNKSRWGLFFAHVKTGTGAHPTSCTIGTGSFRGINRQRRGANHPPLPNAEVENE
jgi:hypothetical protein